MFFGRIRGDEARVSFIAGQGVAELFRLPAKELVTLGFADQRGASDVGCHVTQGVVAQSRDEFPRTRHAECPGTVVQRPSSTGGGILQAFDKGIQFRCLGSIELRQQSSGRGRHQHRERRLVEIIQTVNDEKGGDSPIKGSGARRKIAAVTDAEQGEPASVNLRSSQGVVDDRTHHFLPVVSKIEPLLANHRALSRAFERQHVVAPLHGRDCHIHVELFLSTVEAGAYQHCRARAVIG